MMFNVNQGGRERMIVGNMKGGGDRELEMLLNKIPEVTNPSHLHQTHQSNIHNHNHHLPMSPSPISSSSFSNGFGSSDDGSSPSLSPFDVTHNFDPRLSNNSNEHMLDQFGLSETLNRIHIGDEYKDFSNRLNPNGFEFRDNGITRCNVNGKFYDYGGFQSPISEHSRRSDDDMKLATFLRLREGYSVGNSMESCFTRSQIPSLYSDPKINYLMELAKEQRRGNSNGGIQFPTSPFNDGFHHSQHCAIDSTADSTSTFKQLHSSHLMNPKLALCLGNTSYNPLLRKQSRGIPNGKIHPSLLSMTDTGDVDALNFEDSLIIQGKSLKYVVEKGCDHSKIRKKRSEISGEKTLESTYGSLAEVQGNIYFLAKDQQGCRFLQKIFEEGTFQDVQIIFNEMIDHIVELMMDPFGNYLVQKLLDVSNEEQRTLIVIMVTREPGELVKICLNSHGTRVVQKLIGMLKMKQQISLIIMALEPGFLDLIKDVHGNHVVQRCLQCLTKEHTKFIFNAAAKFCVNIATHRHGCCVLNRCIAHSTGKYREELIAEIAANAFLLAQDAFGNYVVQYIIELKIPSAAMALLSQFDGHYVHLSMQKFSSHVVEKCLRCCEESRSRIVPELLSVPHFDHLLQHPFSNYVIQSALEVTKGRLHAALVEAVQPHMILRSSPYCKKLFSRSLLKK